MSELLERIRTRLLPALLTAAGVTLVAAGLLTYTNPVDAVLPSPTAQVSPSPEPSPSPSPSPSASASPAASPSPSPSPSPSVAPADRVATRIVFAFLDIDLPVIRAPGGRNTYPPCNVAMYTQELSQPGLGGPTYIYAHAREGMFLSMLEESQRNNGRRMIGKIVEVYTSDDQLFLYEVVEVRREVPKSIAYEDPFDALDAGREELWLQTSEGPRGTPHVLQLLAKPLSSGPADHAAAHPVAKPVVCG